MWIEDIIEFLSSKDDILMTCSLVNLDFQNLHHEGRMNIFKMPSRGLFLLF